jgi:hypothetical protein
MNCPACNSKRIGDYQGKCLLHECRKCHAIFGSCYLGDSYNIAFPRLTNDPEADSRAVYFDLQCLGSAGITRRHGWVDPTTHLMTQVG